MTALVDRLSAVVGAAQRQRRSRRLDPRCVDWTGCYRGTASALVRPGNAERSPPC